MIVWTLTTSRYADKSCGLLADSSTAVACKLAAPNVRQQQECGVSA